MEDVFDRFLSYIREERLRQIGIDAEAVTHKEGESSRLLLISRSFALSYFIEIYS